MNKLFPILLSTLLFVQSAFINFDDFIQLDELVEHYQFHLKAYGDNFIVFFSKHYGELKEQHDTNDRHEKEQHEQLPFNHNACGHSAASFVLGFQEVDSLLPSFKKFQSSNFYYLDFESSFERPKVFQPPKQS